MTSNPESNPNIVNANPAKSFFVSMLIKDITLRDAIGDLVDNAVDAIKEKAGNSNDLNGYKIEIKIGKTYFSISDNGFGMEAQIARETAFNFGKNPEHKLIDNSIGQFGIGMKRAFFKMGSNIHVKSTSQTSEFELTINVDEWILEPDIWRFQFDSGTLKENIQNRENKTGLYVKISELSEDSQISFSDDTFIDKLIKEISLEHMLNINKGLVIKINDFTLKDTQITLVNDDKIKPTYWEKISNGQSVKVLAGISNYDAEDGGWYIFCNERLIISKNKTAETVWTGSRGDGVPLWHAQYYRFRGYVFFEAKNSADLPWNTTKNGMDQDSPYYKEVRSQMIIMTRQVMELLDKLKEEKAQGNPSENQKLNQVVDNSTENAKPVTDVLQNKTSLYSKFQYPTTYYNPVKKGNTKKITYQVSKEKYEAVAQHLDVTSPKDVGVMTFDFYYENQL